MTPSQRARIKDAAQELGKALTDAGDDFIVEVTQLPYQPMGATHADRGYIVQVHLKDGEWVA